MWTPMECETKWAQYLQSIRDAQDVQEGVHGCECIKGKGYPLCYACKHLNETCDDWEGGAD